MLNEANDRLDRSIRRMRADKDLELIDWSERFPEESAVQIAVRQSTFCLCGKSKDIGQASCGCKAGL